MTSREQLAYVSSLELPQTPDCLASVASTQAPWLLAEKSRCLRVPLFLPLQYGAVISWVTFPFSMSCQGGEVLDGQRPELDSICAVTPFLATATVGDLEAASFQAATMMSSDGSRTRGLACLQLPLDRSARQTHAHKRVVFVYSNLHSDHFRSVIIDVVHWCLDDSSISVPVWHAAMSDRRQTRSNSTWARSCCSADTRPYEARQPSTVTEILAV